MIPSLEIVPTSATVTFYCLTPYPVKVKFSKRDDKLPRKYNTDERSITLIDVKQKDSGIYKCEASSVHAYHEYTSVLEVAS